MRGSRNIVAEVASGRGGGVLQIRRFRRAVLRFGREHPRDFPWRQSTDQYEVLIGEVLLQRTRAENVVDTYSRFLARWPTPDRLAESSPSEVSTCIRPLGLAKRGPMIHQLGKALRDLGHTPSTPDELMRLPGVGPYTASAVAVFVGRRNLPLLDRVIARVLRRYFGLPAIRRPDSDPLLVALTAELVRSGRARELWFGVLDLAATICTSRPACSQCPLRRDCATVSATQTTSGSSVGLPGRTR